MPRRIVPVLEKLAARSIESPGGCLIWTGSTIKGYGQIRVGKRILRTHRAAWEAKLGPIPDGMNLLHSCDEPLCWNTDHLRPGTQAENMRDRDEAGRHWNSKKTHCSKGHPFDEANTRVQITSDGGLHRRCRACARGARLV